MVRALSRPGASLLDTFVSLLPFLAGLIAVGALSGLIAGLFGVGGGLVTVPAMSFAFQALGYDPDVVMHVAVGTSLATIIVVGSVSARSHARRGAVMPEIIRLWAPWLVGSSLLAGLMAGLFPGNVLRALFGGLALFIAINTAVPFLGRALSRVSASPAANRIAASVIGYASSLMGIGGGSFSVPTLTAFGQPIHKAIGTSAALGVVLAVPGAIGFVLSGWAANGLPPLSLGYVNLPALLMIASIASFAAPIGAALAHRLDQRRLKQAFAVFLAIVAARMLWQAAFG